MRPDRLGIKPFHYAVHDGAFYFSSEIKGLLAAGVPSRPDHGSWAAYLTHGYSDHGDTTFFEGVRSLPPGHILQLASDRLSEPRISRYWDCPVGEVDPVSIDEASARWMELLDDAVRLRLRADVPVGVNLSGGLDSASMMTAVDRQLGAGSDVLTFTASFDDPTYDEAEFADGVPREARWVRHYARLKPGDALGLAENAVWHQEAPFGGIATLAYHNLHGLARDAGVTVLLEGQGVDELLGGYRYFVPHRLLDVLEQEGADALKPELRAWGERRAMFRELRAVRTEGAPLVYQDGTSHLRPGCVAPDIRALAGDAPTFPRPYGDRLRNVLYRDLRHTKLPRVLRMNDRLSMAFGRELREPYLDHRLVELAFGLPGDLKINDGVAKRLLRHAARDRLPDGLRDAPKRAVVTPQREWLAETLASEVEAIIESPEFAQRGLFDPAEVRRTFRTFRETEGRNAFYVWQWVNTELWFRRFD